MNKITPAQERSSATDSPLWMQLERHARGKIQDWIQQLLEGEVEEL